MRPLRHAIVTLCTLAALTGAASVESAAQEGAAPDPAADSVLARLIGEWTMVGRVGGDSVQYTLRVQRLLQGRYIGLHMLDDATPPGYEARVMIGADTTASRIIVHWLDSFGAAYSVPAGYGSARGDTIAFTIAYATGTFRDVLSANGDGTWRLQIDAQAGDGWNSFADYRLLPLRAFDVAPAVANLPRLRQQLEQVATRLVQTYDDLVGSERAVRVRASLDADGNVTGLAIVQGSGLREVDAEALRILSTTRFTPAQRGGAPVPSTVVQPVRFVFPDS